MTKAFVVTGLGFGDEGKGTIVDYIAHSLPEESHKLVVRFNGGPQAAHNVVLPDGRHHTFAQFGSGSFAPHTSTYLSHHVYINPENLIAEAKHLIEVANIDPFRSISVSPSCPIITPYHIIVNRERELARGDNAHGTCGQGFGETVAGRLDNNAPTMFAGYIWGDRSKSGDEQYLIDKLIQIRNDLDVKNKDLNINWKKYVSPEEVLDLWKLDIYNIRLVDFRSRVLSCDYIIFEGAQGVLLDENYGFNPHTTWSTTTTQNALSLCKDANIKDITTIGITRTYSTRHGAGPFPSESRYIQNPEPHNDSNGLQGSFRQGHFDMPLLKYALSVCPVDYLALTHMDRITDPFTYVSAYANSNGRQTSTIGPSTYDLFPYPTFGTFNSLDSVVRAHDLPPIAIFSYGPTWKDKRPTLVKLFNGKIVRETACFGKTQAAIDKEEESVTMEAPVTPKFKTVISLPANIKEFLEEIQGVGEVVSISSEGIVVHLEAESEFDLGVTCSELQHTLSTIQQYDCITITRPVRIN